MLIFEDRVFQFDKIFFPQSSVQQIFTDVVSLSLILIYVIIVQCFLLQESSIDNLLRGINSTILAYGK